ncbi:MAG TPA: phosphoglycerate dehydrogenase [Rhodothermales bacterium]|nr:phosphoglycerate dehydrogenase [Rhodothermales bacterium]
MRVLIADALSSSATAALRDAGHDVTTEPGLKDDALVRSVQQHRPDVLVVRSTKVPAPVMDAGPSLELIVRAGAGYDTIDVEAASERGIFVSNCPGKNAAAVAELTMGLILALDRSIPDNVADARAGRWNKARYSKAEGLKGRTLGVIGLGSIGREVAARARAFGMRVVAWSRSLTEEEAEGIGVERRLSPLDVAKEADIVTLHVAAAAETKQLADSAFFEAMRPGAFFVNTSRSSVVDEQALLRAMDEKKIRAAIDVLEDEPSGKEGALQNPLAQHPNLYLTHHIGASTEQAQEAIAAEAARIINTYAETGRVLNCVNLAERTPATHLLTVRHRDRIGVLAAVLDEVRKAGWNVQEMENLIFAGAEAACARIRFDGDGDQEVVGRISTLDNVLAVSAITL